MVYPILFVISLILFYGYWAWVVKLVGLKNLPSWSHSYPALERVSDSYKYAFQAVMIGQAFLNAILLLELTQGQWFQFLAFLTAAPIAFVGAAPRFGADNPLENKVHMAGAKISAVASLLIVILIAVYMQPIVAVTVPTAAIVAYNAYRVTNNGAKVLWAEMACFWWIQATIGILLYLSFR